MHNKTVLITGGAGFIGVNAAGYFADNGWDVVVFDNFSRKGTEVNRQWLEEQYPNAVRIVTGDVRTDGELLREEMENVDAVLHLAAQVAVTTSIKDPGRDFEDNAIGTFKVLEAVRSSRRKPFFIYASTNKVYGALEHVPVIEEETRYTLSDRECGVSEQEQLDFHSPYGCSKGVADQYVRDYARIYGLRTVVLRQSCIYGRHQFGVEDQGWVAWFAIAAALGKPVTFYGNGKQVRDLLFVDDLVQLYALLTEKQEIVSGKIYNVGGGPDNTLSLQEILPLIKEHLGVELNPNQESIRKGDQPVFISDVRKIGHDVGWKPHTSVSDGFEKMVNWIKENKEVIREQVGG
jgi:CDP-paratose 2-epimerase